MHKIAQLSFAGLRLAAGIPLLALLYLIEPFWRIRFAVVAPERIGKLALLPELYLRRGDLDGRPTRTTCLFFSASPCNRQLQRMWARTVPVVESVWLNRLLHRLLPLLSRTRFIQSIVDNSANHREMALGRPHLAFTAEEEAEGRALLARMGIGEKDWFVCIHARSPDYLNQTGQAAASQRNRYRDSSIENYLEAARWFTAQGGFVLRMGSAVDAPLPDIGNPRIIDYATKNRSDFLDVYLPAKCRYFIGSTSGLTAVPEIFNVPIAWANFASYGSIAEGAKAVFAPKLLRDRASGRFLTLREVVKLGAIPTGPDPENRINYAHFDLDLAMTHPEIEWIENDAEDILGLAKDLVDRVAGREPSDEARRLHDGYLACYGESPHNSPHTARLGPRFALRHKDLIVSSRNKTGRESCP